MLRVVFGGKCLPLQRKQIPHSPWPLPLEPTWANVAVCFGFGPKLALAKSWWTRLGRLQQQQTATATATAALKVNGSGKGVGCKPRGQECCKHLGSSSGSNSNSKIDALTIWLKFNKLYEMLSWVGNAVEPEWSRRLQWQWCGGPCPQEGGLGAAEGVVLSSEFSGR